MTGSHEKIVTDLDRLREYVAALPRPLVFTNGCFDILHRGHVDYLQKAARLGASLVIGVNDDASIKRLNKGADRPINPLEDRMVILAALSCVSLVVPFAEDTPLVLIQAVRPDTLVKGGDWSTDKIVGAEFVKGYGGQVHAIPITYQRSTTALIERIRQHG